MRVTRVPVDPAALALLPRQPALQHETVECTTAQMCHRIHFA